MCVYVSNFMLCAMKMMACLSFMFVFIYFFQLFCSFKAELLEIRSEDPSLHIFLVPGNPGCKLIQLSSECTLIFQCLSGCGQIACDFIIHERTFDSTVYGSLEIEKHIVGMVPFSTTCFHHC